MAAGYNLDTTGDLGVCDDITIGAGQQIDLACRWDFDNRHWQRMAFAPADEGIVTIVSEWIERDVQQDKWGTHVTVILWTRLRNDTGDVITVTPTVFVAPSRYRR